MKTKLASSLLIFLLISIGFAKIQESDEYIIITWNDLGMHCANKDFSNMAVLPPYNNLMAQVVRKGDEFRNPAIVTDFLTVKYSIPGNTYSVGKTNFWEYDEQLFGIDLAPDVGLTGLGLTGEMEDQGYYFMAEGIPVTPYTDADLQNEDPYQLALVELFDPDENQIAWTENVIPVSNEISCVSAGCHPNEDHIFEEHEDEGGFDRQKRPQLCASCHASNALGTTGDPEAKSLSYVIHEYHAEETQDCYKCHPGENTQCLRGVMAVAGMVCRDCHGGMEQVASSIRNGRRPWLDEPQCGNPDCHGSAYAEEDGKLFRQSRGHGGLFCSACHGSPHALVPSSVDRDNQQNIRLQGEAGILKKCEVCHGMVPDAPGPHGYRPTHVEAESTAIPAKTELHEPAPNPLSGSGYISFSIQVQAKVRISIYDLRGRKIETIFRGNMMPGKYRADLNAGNMPDGIYFIRMNLRGKEFTRKLIVNK